MTALREDQIGKHLKEKADYDKTISETKLNRAQVSDIKSAKIRANIALCISAVAAAGTLLLALKTLLR